MMKMACVYKFRLQNKLSVCQLTLLTKISALPMHQSLQCVIGSILSSTRSALLSSLISYLIPAV